MQDGLTSFPLTILNCLLAVAMATTLIPEAWLPHLYIGLYCLRQEHISFIAQKEFFTGHPPVQKATTLGLFLCEQPPESIKVEYFKIQK